MKNKIKRISNKTITKIQQAGKIWRGTKSKTKLDILSEIQSETYLFKEIVSLSTDEQALNENFEPIKLPLAGYLKDARIEFRTSTEFKSLTMLASIASQRWGTAEYITSLIWKDALTQVLAYRPHLLEKGGPLEKFENMSIGDIVLAVGRDLNPDFFDNSGIFQNILKKRAEASEKKKSYDEFVTFVQEKLLPHGIDNTIKYKLWAKGLGKKGSKYPAFPRLPENIPLHPEKYFKGYWDTKEIFGIDPPLKKRVIKIIPKKRAAARTKK